MKETNKEKRERQTMSELMHACMHENYADYKSRPTNPVSTASETTLKNENIKKLKAWVAGRTE